MLYSDELYHYGRSKTDGAPVGSGRYPLGSGDDPFQHQIGGSDFRSTVKQMRAEGASDNEIAKFFGMNTSEFRNRVSTEHDREKLEDQRRAMELKKRGFSNVKIGETLGKTEGYVRSLLKSDTERKVTATQRAADVLENAVKEKNYIDVSKGTELTLGITETRLKTAIASLKDKGYEIHYIHVPQMTKEGQYTTVKVLTRGSKDLDDYKAISHELYLHKDLIKPVQAFSTDKGETFTRLVMPPPSVDSKRIFIRYSDDPNLPGSALDGTIELRRGVPDIAMGKSSYAQVRVAVDGTHYLKGMAFYSDNVPDGYDIVYNTKKASNVPPYEVFKTMEPDPKNPFKASVDRQNTYYDEKGKEHVGVLNILKEEGAWDDYSKTLASQMLSKQPIKLIRTQLDLTYADKLAEFDEIKKITNPTLRKKLLETFADSCDASAVHLKVNALPRQASKVILPVPTLKDTEIYAPTMKQGETVALIRYPHGGIFEIPVLKVNNRHADAKVLLGQAPDAVGINSKVAQQLSGADFDGDTVVVIPCNSSASKVNIKASPVLNGLKNFDTDDYKYTAEQLDAGAKILSKTRTQTEMGKVSNLITDMTIKGATEEELVRAVKHSMVIIDATKHKLDYKRSFEDNRIAELKTKYQGGPNKGASTLISKASAQYRVDERTEGKYVTDPETGKTKKLYIDPNTGEKLYTETGRTYVDKGVEKKAQTLSTQMAEAKDAHELSSGSTVEEAYARYANKVKDLGNRARKEMLSTPRLQRDPSATRVYQEEVKVLDAKLKTAEANAPRERYAQLLANSIIDAKREYMRDLDYDHRKKEKAKALREARDRVGAKKQQIEITDREWTAIQSGAISDDKLQRILNNTDVDKLKERALPRTTTTLSAAKKAKLKAMYNSGYYTLAEIADALGVSASTVSKAVKG